MTNTTKAVDVTVRGTLEFSATEVTFEAVSERARQWFGEVLGAGAVSATAPKSNSFSLVSILVEAGFVVEEVRS